MRQSVGIIGTGWVGTSGAIVVTAGRGGCPGETRLDLLKPLPFRCGIPAR
ncbi:MAG TPA: hypothetical protein VEO54_04090 [Thermoanaerobaculia bacterium]|nr:hypothetical protein [Thermoanaerobaculia bacterium]